MKIYSTGDNLEGYGGAQKVMVDVHQGIKSHLDAKIIGLCKFEDINKNYGIPETEYIRFSNPFKFRNSILLIHARRLLTFYYLINKIFRLKMKLIYVSHNTYETLKKVTFFPKNVVTISDKVTKNLIEYFNVPINHITKIYNGVINFDNRVILDLGREEALINILYAARINSVKQQLEIVRNLKGKLPKNVQIVFAGSGSDEDELKSLIVGDPNFKFIGFVKEMQNLISQYDYLMLFSQKEGLPISLIEGTAVGKPLIINDVGGNLEIGRVNENAFLANSWEELAATINSLPARSDDLYKKMSSESLRIYDENFRYETMIDKYLSLIKKVYDGK
jgi:glycosyltransferase involved in cell wall biosynthesis